MVSTFTMYILLDNKMDAENVFTLVSTFMVVQSSLRALPLVISYLIQAFISIRRIEGYLAEPEINVTEVSVAIENAEEKVLEEKVLYSVNQSRKEEWSLKVKGNFFWDLEENEKKEDDKKKKKKKIKKDLEKGLLDEEKKEQEPKMFKALDNLNLKLEKGKFNAIIGE